MRVLSPLRGPRSSWGISRAPSLSGIAHLQAIRPWRPPPPLRHRYTSETCWGSLAWRSPYSHLMTRALRSMTEMP